LLVDTDFIGRCLYAHDSIELDATNGASIHFTLLDGSNYVGLVESGGVRMIERSEPTNLNGRERAIADVGN
jgi:hypothetical protein